MKDVRTWIEIDAKALRRNAKQFLGLLGSQTRLMAVIKSNAYGHGLMQVAESLAAISEFGKQGWFGVDSITEALRLRKDGVLNPILVLGATMPARINEAAAQKISVSVSNFDMLKRIGAAQHRPQIHIKCDTGMHRQGFFVSEIPKVIKALQQYTFSPEGLYTHFAAAKDPLYPTYTHEQLSAFNDISARFVRAGFKNFLRHSAASGGAILFPETHADLVRVGMGLYGYWPSMESKIALGRLNLDNRDYRGSTSIVLKPVLTWKTIVSEIKEIPAGAFVGYDCTEKATKKTKIAILPIGYWHGYDRGLSSIGEVLIRGKRAKVLGRVSMDMLIVDVSNIPRIKMWDEVALIGTQGKEMIGADELALKIGTTVYEFLTRINPLIRRIVV